ncbi:hypothetical protein PS043_09450 [Escherichia albertii]|uniref:hypothetical protein n=1 Tax=Escherichia albertii TaxID=208962 RepID=UPI001374D263|nr:hypothetical protein [Escherichia albertii]MCU7289870.1 hypothetical protein [Escherichia albertii]QTA15945.1 hypothetical protein FYK19_08675 [Escherichia albertii]WDC31535.1 hypothetical protein PS043_09450 [Escherichia albertii]HAX3034882.1 hypothetical protein [Escherichia albertii]
MSLAPREDACGWFMAKAETRALLENVHLVNEKNKVPSISTEVITVLLMWKRLTFDSQKRGGDLRPFINLLDIMF